MATITVRDDYIKAYKETVNEIYDLMQSAIAAQLISGNVKEKKVQREAELRLELLKRKNEGDKTLGTDADKDAWIDRETAELRQDCLAAELAVKSLEFNLEIARMQVKNVDRQLDIQLSIGNGRN